jgi:hypothetical protein
MSHGWKTVRYGHMLYTLDEVKSKPYRMVRW